MTKQELKRKHPEEQLLMFDCPNCGQEVNKKFVEKIVDDIEQAVREETIETCLDIVFAETYPFDGKVVRVFDDPNVAYKIIKNLLKN